MSVRSSLGGKIFFVCAGVALIVALVGSLILYSGASHSLRQTVREQLKRTAATAAIQIDPELHAKVTTRADESSVPYRKLKATLARIRAANPGMRYVYTMRKTSDPNVFQFVVDAEQTAADMSHVGGKYDVSKMPQMKSSFNAPIADEEPSSDKWGTWLSGYAPIRDKSGKAVAIIGMDMSMSQLRKHAQNLRMAAVLTVLAALVFSLLLSFVVTRYTMRPICTLSRAADRVGSGDLDSELLLTGPDEINHLGECFNTMVSKLKDDRDKLVERSTHDFLTGLANHMYLHERLEHEIARAARYKHDLTLLVVDLDRFKSINDSLGHAVGDSILRQLAGLVKSVLRDGDLAARYGGDEFAVFLPETNSEEGMVVAERIRAAVESHRFHTAPVVELDEVGHKATDQPAIGVTVTIGVGSFPHASMTKDGLIMAADIALCRAKHISRNSIGEYSQQNAGKEAVDPSDLYRILRHPDLAAIRSLAAAVDARDHYTSGHSERVVKYAVRMAVGLNLGEEMVDAVKVGGLLHDVGKIGLSDSVLNKRGSLSQEEMETIRQHPSVGASILKRAPQLEQILPAILFHHERYDGKGYPKGLSGEEIPLVARILAIADAYDAMTSDRPYRRAMKVEDALVEMRMSAGTQFDPELVEAFFQCMSLDLKKSA